MNARDGDVDRDSEGDDGSDDLDDEDIRDGNVDGNDSDGDDVGGVIDGTTNGRESPEVDAGAGDADATGDIETGDGEGWMGSGEDDGVDAPRLPWIADASNAVDLTVGETFDRAEVDLDLRHQRPSPWGRLDLSITWQHAVRVSADATGPARDDELWLLATWRR